MSEVVLDYALAAKKQAEAGLRFAWPNTEARDLLEQAVGLLGRAADLLEAEEAEHRA